MHAISSYLQFRVIVVTDPQTNKQAHKQTRTITIHCAAASLARSVITFRSSISITGNRNSIGINDLRCLGTQNLLSTGAGHVSGAPNSICTMDKNSNLYGECLLLLFVNNYT